MKRNVLMFSLCILTVANFSYAQYDNLDFNPKGIDASCKWIIDSNGNNPLLALIANPASKVINTIANVTKFTSRLNEASFALSFTNNLDGFEFEVANAIDKLIVNKPTISNVGMKLKGSNEPFKTLTANNVINQWEKLTHDFSEQNRKDLYTNGSCFWFC